MGHPLPRVGTDQVIQGFPVLIGAIVVADQRLLRQAVDRDSDAVLRVLLRSEPQLYCATFALRAGGCCVIGRWHLASLHCFYIVPSSRKQYRQPLLQD